jgi:hypothetical protein
MPMRRSLLALSLLVPPAFAQAIPAPDELAREAGSLAEQVTSLAKGASPNDPALAAAKKELAAFVAKCEAAVAWSERHYVEAGSPLLGPCDREALAITEAGLKQFPKSRFLWDHKGFALLSLVANDRPSAARLRGLQDAAAAFTAATKLGPDTMHAHVGLCQVLDHLGDVDGALRELQVVLADPQGKATVPAWLLAASLNLRKGNTKEVLTALADAPADQAFEAAILKLRAHALAKDAAATATAITALLAVEDSPRTQLEAADAWFVLGKKAEAKQALARLPAADQTGSDDDREAALQAQSGRALAVYWDASDVSAKGPLRAAWTQALGHKFVVMEPAKPKPKETDLSSSPRAMTYLLAQAMAADSEGTKAWANRALLVACLLASPEHKASPFEASTLQVVDKNPVPADDIPALVLAAKFAVGDPYAVCALSGQHAIERIAAAAPAKK